MSPPLEVIEPWQLSILTGQLAILNQRSIDELSSLTDNWNANIGHYLAWSNNTNSLDWIKKYIPDLLQRKTNNGAILAHYAAWSGNTVVLHWINTHDPDSLWRRNDKGATIAHYAVSSGNSTALDWIKAHTPDLLQSKNNNGATLAHSAAQSSNLAALDWIKTYAQDLLQSKNNNGATIAHYAVSSDNIAALDWIKVHTPDLLRSKNNKGATLAHYAASSGNIAVLDWIKAHTPDLLQSKNNNGATFARSAVSSGNIAVLDWIKKHDLDLFQSKDKYGATLAHYAVSSSNPAALDWIKIHIPDLLQRKTNIGATIVDYAAWSSNANQFNRALALSPAPDSFTVARTKPRIKEIIDTLNRALDSNFTLIAIDIDSNLLPAIQDQINLKLQRNREIKAVMPGLKQLMIGFHQQNNPFSNSEPRYFPNEVLFNVFQQALPAGIPKDIVKHVFDALLKNLRPDNVRFKTLQYQIVNRIDQQISCLKKAQNHRFFGLIEGHKKEIDHLIEMKQCFNAADGDRQTLQATSAALVNNLSVLAEQKNFIHRLFNPDHQSKNQQMVDEICGILKIK